MSDDSTETEIEATEATEAEAPAAEAPADEAPAAEAADEAPAAEASADEAPAAEAADEAPAAAVPAADADLPDVAGEGADADTAAETYEAPVAVATQTASVARVYICKHGHRTISLWSTPETCLRRVKGHICGESVVPLADAPADAKEKMLNPLKASKKAAKKS